MIRTLKVTQTIAFHIDIIADTNEEAELAFHYMDKQDIENGKYHEYFDEELEDDTGNNVDEEDVLAID